MPAVSTALGKSSPQLVSPLPGVERVEYRADGAQNELLSLDPGETRLYATQIALPTYPMEAYESVAVDSVYRWPYLHFDRQRFLAEAPLPQTRYFEMLVLENAYLRVSILPEVGGRIWQIEQKATGDTMFYQNREVKPSPWGPANQLGWLALGGLEWALPVNEHGYDWGTAWNVSTFQDKDGSVGATIATPRDGRLLSAEIVVTLHPNSAYLSISPTVHNLADHSLDFHFWQTAALAPGPDNEVGPDLHFAIPSRLMSIHSTGDAMLPGPGLLFTWPTYFGRDLSRLGNWHEYIGAFEYPRAHGPFVGVYDPTRNAGAVRIFPAEIAHGSKVFGLGWSRRIGSEDFTDDGSTYVELHGGLSPTFAQPYTLAGGATVQWEESWYPVEGIGDMVYANQFAALNLTRTAGGMRVALYPTEALSGTLTIFQDGMGLQGEQARGSRTEPRQAVAQAPLQLAPTVAFVHDVTTIAPDAAVTVQISDEAGKILLEYSPSGNP